MITTLAIIVSIVILVGIYIAFENLNENETSKWMDEQIKANGLILLDLEESERLWEEAHEKDRKIRILKKPKPKWIHN